jgi:predicted dehydrogenase
VKQVLQSYRSGELWLADVPAPALEPGGVLVRTAASLVSAGTERAMLDLASKSLLGKARARPDLVRQVLAKIRTEGLFSTLEKVSAKLDAAVPMGYSSAGTVIEAGNDARGLRVGDRVACAGAGWASHAEIVYVPQNLCVRIPDGVPFEDACFATLGAIAMQGVRQADLRLGERVVVVGLGLVGLLTVQIAKAAGARVLGTDPSAERAELARALGADAVASSDPRRAAADLTDGRGADAVIVAAATPSNGPIEDAAEMARAKGRVVVVGVVGLDVPREPFYRKELDLRLSMSYGPGRYDPDYEERGRDYPFAHVRWTERRNMESFVELLADGKVTPSRLVSHTYAIDDALDAYERLRDGSSALGIVLRYPRPESAGEVVSAARTVELRPPAAGTGRGIGVLGAGAFARGVLLPALARHDDVRRVGLCTATGRSAADAAGKHGFAYATTDPARVLDDPDVAAVFIATRHDSHARLVLDALARGKHVFVEKPLCIRPDELAAIDRALTGRDGTSPVLTVGFNRRFSPHTEAVVAALAERRGPRVVDYRVHPGTLPREHWLHDPDVGGGRIVGEVCHFVDLCERLVGSRPVRVAAEALRTPDGPDDTCAIVLGYEDGSLATIRYLAAASTALPKERIEVSHGGATAVIDDFRRVELHGLRGASAGRGRQDKGFDAEIARFLGAVRDGGDWPVPWDSLRRTTAVTFAILESLRTGHAVDVP